MNLYKIAFIIAGNYDFQTKMKINQLVIEELAKETGINNSTDIMKKLLESPIHSYIQALAEAIKEEADKITS
jgi:SOS-response transcriptional repressor LexA